MQHLIETKSILLSDLLAFTKTFFAIKNGRTFETPLPIGRESHYEIITKELELVLVGKNPRLIVNVPPGHGKSTMLCYFIAWAIAHFPDSQFMYISYSYTLAEKNTALIREIISMPLYKELFGVEIDKNFAAKGDFKTNLGGRVRAYGSSGTITGMDAGLPYLERFSGCIVMDDMHKPDEVHSDVMRDNVINNFNQTILPRKRSPTTPMIFIGQRLHELDLPAFLIAGGDGFEWKRVILKARDEVGNMLCESIFSREQFEKAMEFNNYTCSAQYQQDPQPAGGTIFKPEYFPILDWEPEFISSFITIDTAETSKSYNDATVFSFFGLYRPQIRNVELNCDAIHWIYCDEIRIEPKDLENYFMDFYAQCMRHKTKPSFVAIEKKSTGVTLSSILKSIPGLRIIDIERTKASGSKTARFLEIQQYAASRLITLPSRYEHTNICIEHLRKITANDTHAHDDIADTLYDAVKLALIDKMVQPPSQNAAQERIAREMAARFNTIQHAKEGRWR